jgi:hypothetical protein
MTDRMRRAAVEYAAAGWSISPVWPLSSASACACPAGRSCANPGAHTVGLSGSGAEWAAQVWRSRPWNIALYAGAAVDVIEAGTALGAQAMRVLERAGKPPYPAVARTADGRWLFVVASAPGQPELPDWAVWRCAGSTVLLPPSRRLTGRDRWVWVPRYGRLPDPAATVEALHCVRLHDWEVGADDRPDRPEPAPRV